MKQAELRDMFTRPPGVPLNQPLWYLLTPCLLLYQILQLWRLGKHWSGSWWLWTSRWRRYPNGILLWL